MNGGVIGSVSNKHIYFLLMCIPHMCVYVCRRIRIYTWDTYTSSRILVTYTHTHGYISTRPPVGYISPLLSSPYIYNIWKEMKKYFII